LPETAELFRICALRHGIDPKYCRQAQQMIHAALMAPVPLHEAKSVPGLGRCSQSLREVEFLYPFPERCHPRLDQVPDGKWRIERGYIRGFIDYVFELGGRIYLADWKSDILPDYRARTVEEHVQRNYQIQIDLYALALARMLDIHNAAGHDQRFGGLLYCFLRGMA